MLMVYSSVSPGRMKRTLWPSMETVPLLGSACFGAIASWTAAVLCRFGAADTSKAPEDWRTPRPGGAPKFMGVNGANGLLASAFTGRPTDVATTRKRSFTALVTVEVSHN